MYFTPFSGVSIVDFEQVNVSRVLIKLDQPIFNRAIKSFLLKLFNYNDVFKTACWKTKSSLEMVFSEINIIFFSKLGQAVPFKSTFFNLLKRLSIRRHAEGIKFVEITRKGINKESGYIARKKKQSQVRCSCFLQYWGRWFLKKSLFLYNIPINTSQNILLILVDSSKKKYFKCAKILKTFRQCSTSVFTVYFKRQLHKMVKRTQTIFLENSYPLKVYYYFHKKALS